MCGFISFGFIFLIKLFINWIFFILFFLLRDIYIRVRVYVFILVVGFKVYFFLVLFFDFDRFNVVILGKEGSFIDFYFFFGCIMLRF